MARILGDVLDWIKRKPPTSTFKQLFLETKALLLPIMSGNAKSPAEGLKDSECERGAITTRPSIPHVAPVDPYEKTEMTKIKTKLPDGTNYHTVPFRAGSNEDYVNHIIAMISLVEQKGLENSVETVFVVASENEEKVGPLYKKLNMSKHPQEKESIKKQIDTTEKDLEKAEKYTLKEIVKAYELFCTYFISEARGTQWDKVVQEMHQKDPWVAVNGSLSPGPHKKTWESFLDCIELNKLTVFSCDTAELQRYYMQQHVRKPHRVTVRAFVTRMGLLNNYLAYLPTVKDSSMAIKDTKKGNIPFNKADLAGIVLKVVPTSWVNQYNLTHSTLPKSPRLLLPDLENIERVMNEKCAESAKAKGKDGAALAGAKSSLKKRASTGSSERVPKKAKAVKFRQHCKNNGGPYTSHNTKECRKYDKDDKAVAATGKKPYKKKPYKKDGGGNDKQMAFLTDAIKSLVRKGLKKAVKKKHKKRSRNDSSSDSDSK
jgi:hypothetical protein